jgi:hypothetical protein
MQRNYTFLACVYGLFVVTMRCITYVAVYNEYYNKSASRGQGQKGDLPLHQGAADN